MYLFPTRASVGSGPKGLGAFRLRKGLDIAGLSGRTRRGLRGLGDDPDFIVAAIGPSDAGTTGAVDDTQLIAPMSIAQTNQLYDPSAPMPPTQPGPSIQQAYSSVLTSAQASQNPTDYTSPQAAIAAGLPAQQVYSSWASALAKYPTQQAALAAGVPAGVVTQLWTASRSAAPTTSSSILSSTTFGIPNLYLLAGGGFLVALLAGRKR